MAGGWPRAAGAAGLPAGAVCATKSPGSARPRADGPALTATYGHTALREPPQAPTRRVGQGTRLRFYFERQSRSVQRFGIRWTSAVGSLPYTRWAPPVNWHASNDQINTYTHTHHKTFVLVSEKARAEAPRGAPALPVPASAGRAETRSEFHAGSLAPGCALGAHSERLFPASPGARAHAPVLGYLGTGVRRATRRITRRGAPRLPLRPPPRSRRSPRLGFARRLALKATSAAAARPPRGHTQPSGEGDPAQPGPGRSPPAACPYCPPAAPPRPAPSRGWPPPAGGGAADGLGSGTPWGGPTGVGLEGTAAVRRGNGGGAGWHLQVPFTEDPLVIWAQRFEKSCGEQGELRLSPTGLSCLARGAPAAHRPSGARSRGRRGARGSGSAAPAGLREGRLMEPCRAAGSRP